MFNKKLGLVLIYLYMGLVHIWDPVCLQSPTTWLILTSQGPILLLLQQFSHRPKRIILLGILILYFLTRYWWIKCGSRLVGKWKVGQHWECPKIKWIQEKIYSERCAVHWCEGRGLAQSFCTPLHRRDCTALHKRPCTEEIVSVCTSFNCPHRLLPNPIITNG